MALVEAWRSKVAANPGLLVASVEFGLKKLGYQCIKAEQLSAVEAVLKGNHVFVSIPTGFGKSLISIASFLCREPAAVNICPTCGTYCCCCLIPAVVNVQPND